MSQEKIAIDVALIPSDEMVQRAVQMNRGFLDSKKKDYVLDVKTCIPHITLLMGLIARDQIPEVSQKLENIAKKFSGLNLQITSVDTKHRSDGLSFSTLVVEKNPELQQLHKTIVAELRPNFNYDNVRKNMFSSPPKLDDIPVFWIKGFAKNNILEKYHPHITIGFGKPQGLSLPIPFTTSKLALCHLGNYCTCRKILWASVPQ